MGSEESCTFLISPPTLLLLVASSFRKVTVTITVTQDRRWTARRAATTAALYPTRPHLTVLGALRTPNLNC